MILTDVAACAWTLLMTLVAHPPDSAVTLNPADREFLSMVSRQRFLNSNKTLSRLTWSAVQDAIRMTRDQSLQAAVCGAAIPPKLLQGETQYSQYFGVATREVWDRLDKNQQYRAFQIMNQLNRQTAQLFSEYMVHEQNDFYRWAWAHADWPMYESLEKQIASSRKIVQRRLGSLCLEYHQEIRTFITPEQREQLVQHLGEAKEITVGLVTSRPSAAGRNAVFSEYENPELAGILGLTPSEARELWALTQVIREEFLSEAERLLNHHHDKIRSILPKRSKAIVKRMYGAPFAELSWTRVDR